MNAASRPLFHSVPKKGRSRPHRPDPTRHAGLMDQMGADARPLRPGLGVALAIDSLRLDHFGGAFSPMRFNRWHVTPTRSTKRGEAGGC